MPAGTTRSAAPRDPASVGSLVRRLRSAGPGSYLITTTTQERYLEQVAGYPADWGARLRARLAAAPGVRTAFTDRDAVVFTMRWPPGQARQPRPATSAAAPAQATAWTPVGLAALSLLLIMLTAREIISAGVPRARRLVMPLTIAAVPLLGVLLIAVAERFLLLS